jgi:F0F1-type ATP synthase membrane subunit c/vacuolar-type H+-ATPase subunit K
MPEQDSGSPKEKTFMLNGKMITVAMMATVVVYIVAAYILTSNPAFKGRVLDGGLSVVLSLMAVGNLVAAPKVTKIAFGALRRSASLEQAYFSSLIIGLAMREASAVIGFVLTFISADSSWVVAFGALTLFSMFQVFPSEARMKELADSGRFS